MATALSTDRLAAELVRARRQVEVLEMAVEEMHCLCHEAGVDDATIRASVEEPPASWIARQQPMQRR